MCYANQNHETADGDARRPHGPRGALHGRDGLHCLRRRQQPGPRGARLPGDRQGPRRERDGRGVPGIPGLGRETGQGRRRQPEGDESLLQEDPRAGPRRQQGGRKGLGQERAVLPHQRLPGPRHADGDHGRGQPAAAPRPARGEGSVCPAETGAETLHRELPGRRRLHEPPCQLPVAEREPHLQPEDAGHARKEALRGVLRR